MHVHLLINMCYTIGCTEIQYYSYTKGDNQTAVKTRSQERTWEENAQLVKATN